MKIRNFKKTTKKDNINIFTERTKMQISFF